MALRDRFDMAASFVVEEHIRIHKLTVVPHPDSLKDAIAAELRKTWNAAVNACTSIPQILVVETPKNEK